MRENNEKFNVTFHPPIRVEFERFGTKETCNLVSLDKNNPLTEDNLEQIVEICNQPLVYKYIFEEKYQGRKYTLEDARKFVSWANDGWLNNTHFVFLAKNSKDEVVAACDIKSVNKEHVEVGYWASASEPGVITNAVGVMCKKAKEAGFNKLFGMIRPENKKSVGVLTRNSFTPKGTKEEDGVKYKYFELDLTKI